MEHIDFFGDKQCHPFRVRLIVGSLPGAGPRVMLCQAESLALKPGIDEMAESGRIISHVIIAGLI